MLTLHTNTVNTNFSALFTEFAIVIEAVEALIVGELGWIFTATDSKVYLIVSRSSTVEALIYNIFMMSTMNLS